MNSPLVNVIGMAGIVYAVAAMTLTVRAAVREEDTTEGLIIFGIAVICILVAEVIHKENIKEEGHVCSTDKEKEK